MSLSYPLLAKYLSSFDAEYAYDEIVCGITDFSPRGRFGRVAMKDWTSEDVLQFVRSLEFIQPFTNTICTIFEQECVDGAFLAEIDEDKWTTRLGLPLEKFVLLKVLLEGIHAARLGLRTTLMSNPVACEGQHALVAAGVVADLSHLSPDKALALDAADRSCQEQGQGYCYGQLVVLGYKEYYQDGGDRWFGVGLPNEKLVLKRRKVPNGVSAVGRTAPGTSININTTNAKGSAWEGMSTLIDSPSIASIDTGRTPSASATLGRTFCIKMQYPPAPCGEGKDESEGSEEAHFDVEDLNGAAFSYGLTTPARNDTGLPLVPPTPGLVDDQYHQQQYQQQRDQPQPQPQRRGALALDPFQAQQVEEAMGHRVDRDALDEAFLRPLHVHIPDDYDAPLEETEQRRLRRAGPPRGYVTHQQAMEQHQQGAFTAGLSRANNAVFETSPISSRHAQVTPSPAAAPVEILLLCTPDPACDMFTIGRMPGNDLLIRGPLHEDRRVDVSNAGGVYTGPVSRFACRILCERLPPYRSYVYAGAFNEHGQIVLPEYAPKVLLPPDARLNSTAAPGSGTHDALTPFGVRLWHPRTKQWTEVTVLGNICTAERPEDGELPGKLLDQSLYTNELVEGSIIDLNGVSITFQSPQAMAARLGQQSVQPESIIGSLNSMKPICPVLLQNIDFAFVDAKERALNAFRRMESEGRSFSRRMPFQVPASDYSQVDENKKSMVFPACGHVHGYHANMVGRPCPMCRMRGPFVPIAFSFEPAICARRPTHVFNPCGHVASRSTCEMWSSTPLPDMPDASLPGHPKCPFCATRLVMSPVTGGPFNRLVLQCDEAWSSDEEDEVCMACGDSNNQDGLSVDASMTSLGSRSFPWYVTPSSEADPMDQDSIDSHGHTTNSSNSRNTTDRLTASSPLSMLDVPDATPQELFLRDRPLRFPKVMPLGTEAGGVLGEKA